VPYIFCPGGALTIQGRSAGLKRLYQALVGRRLIAGARRVLATTPLEARQFETSGVPAAKIALIPNGVNDDPGGLSAAEFRRAQYFGDEPLLLFMGRLNPIKGPDLLLEAFGRVAGRFPAWRLVFAGADEGLAPALRERAQSLGLSERVRFAGLLAQPEAVGAYRAASLLAVPSRHEAMSQVALEAGVVGTPVLLTDACGFDDVERVGGGRVVGATVDGLAAGLQALLSTPDQLPEMGARLQAFVRQHYSWPVIVRKYVELLTSVRRR
jgi:glycosyltransferase involved in cell wall biosynthesis